MPTTGGVVFWQQGEHIVVRLFVLLGFGRGPARWQNNLRHWAQNADSQPWEQNGYSRRFAAAINCRFFRLLGPIIPPSWAL